MSNPELPNSQKFLQTFATPDGRFHLDPHEMLSTEVTEGNVTVWVGAEFNASNDPYIAVAFKEGDPEVGEQKTSAASIELPATLWFNDGQNGFELPLPETDGLEVEINDKAGLRRYNIPDLLTEPVTVELWVPDPKYTNDEPGKYANPVIVEGYDQTLMRRFVSDVLSATVELARAVQPIAAK